MLATADSHVLEGRTRPSMMRLQAGRVTLRFTVHHLRPINILGPGWRLAP